MALALRLVLLLLLAVALPARAAQAAPMPARGADWDQDMDYLESLLDDGLKTSAHAGAEPLGEAASQPMSTTEPQGEDEGVSAGRTSPAPLLVPARKPGSHRRGPPKGKTQARGEYKDLKPSELLDQLLSDLERRREMEAEAVLKAAFPGGSSGSLAASAAGREAMPGTVTGGRTSPAPLVVPARKPGSHRRGPPKGKTQARGEYKDLKPSELLDQMLSDLERRREMEAEAVLKAAFPGGSSGSLAASAAGREAMPGTVTGDWDQDMDYLESLLDDGLKTSAHAGAEPLGEAASQPMSTTEPQGEDEGVSAGRTSPAPLLVPARKPGSHRRGPPKGKTQARGEYKDLKPSELLDQMLSDLERRREMEAEAVLKAAFPGGSSGSLAASAAGREAMPGTVTGDSQRDLDYLEVLANDGVKILENAGG
ncbi:uncharacterized protein [Aphelocoma coerulescens]|uniref:uncharacterized protein n=1 Tax=Aphelocoma coerulescens TaxID=39617 RepID=UPI00360462F6